jgi:phage shock protein PspC (stress-responsive transcriptional regulator)
MTRLALAIGFLAVFGFVAYVISILLMDYFKNKNNKS